jgi:hypothetical protein
VRLISSVIHTFVLLQYITVFLKPINYCDTVKEQEGEKSRKLEGEQKPFLIWVFGLFDAFKGTQMKTNPLSALYYPFSRCINESSLKQMLLEISEISGTEISRTSIGLLF